MQSFIIQLRFIANSALYNFSFPPRLSPIAADYFLNPKIAVADR